MNSYFAPIHELTALKRIRLDCLCFWLED